MRRILLAILALTVLYTVCGCSDRYIKGDTFAQAVPLTPEMLEEISREIFEGTGTDATTSDETNPIPAETLPPLTDDSTVYWLSGGKVSHVSRDCRYIRDRDDALTGTLAEAQIAGKSKVCSVCYPTN